jgi:hypothetical protein
LEWRKEGIIDLLSTINPQAIDTVRGDEIRDPSLKRTQHISIFSPQIRERHDVVSFPADLDTGRIVVINETERVKVRFLNWISNDESFGEARFLPS